MAKLPHRRHFLHLAAGTVALPAISRVAIAQDAYPSRPIHVVVGFTPGTAADITARVFGTSAAPILGQQVVVENKPGAGSILGAEHVARAAKDGYTLSLTSLSVATSLVMKPEPDFDLLRDLAPISLLTKAPVVLVVNPADKLHSVAELIALAKSKPGEVLCANVGVGSLPQFAAELFAQRAGIKLQQVPYPGSPQAVTDLVAGRVQMFFSPASSVIGQVAAGQLTALATAAEKRASILPDVPSMAEAGIPDYDASLWFGLTAPAGTPQAAIEKIAGAAQSAMHSREAIETLNKQGFDPVGDGPESFGRFLHSEVVRWTEVGRAAGIKG
jgi:tripartite-type tricarboxylate transporter receptor subunit TctC